MGKIKVFMSIVLLASFLGFAACSPQNENAGSGNLKIYICDQIRGEFFKYAANEFNAENEQIKVEPVDFEGDFVAFCSKMTTELSAGEGPDIIAINTSVFQSVNKVFSSGIFYNLDKLLSKDKNLNMGDYNARVMDCGVFEGKRYLIPLNYYINVLSIGKDKLESDNFDIGAGGQEWITWDKAADISESYMKNHGEKYFLSFLNIIDFIQSSGIDLVDYKSKKTYFNTPAFIDLLKTYKMLCSGVIPEELLKEKNYDFEFINKKSLASIDNSFLNLNVPGQYQRQGTRVYPICMSGGSGKVVASPFILVGINSKCSGKEAAFEFTMLKMKGRFAFTI